MATLAAATHADPAPRGAGAAVAPRRSKPRIVIVGGGFAGVKCAQVLLRGLGDAAEIVVFSRENHMVFQPLLPDVAGSSLNPRAVAPPLRLLLPGATCRTEEVLEIRTATQAVVHEAHDGTPRSMGYDHPVTTAATWSASTGAGSCCSRATSATSARRSRIR